MCIQSVVNTAKKIFKRGLPSFIFQLSTVAPIGTRSSRPMYRPRLAQGVAHPLQRSAQHAFAPFASSRTPIDNGVSRKARRSRGIPIIELREARAYLFDHPLILLKRRKTASVRVFSLKSVCCHQIKFDRAFFVLLSSHPMKRR
ncbi:hypothetical protein [Caballeronia sp. KNU42]